MDAYTDDPTIRDDAGLWRRIPPWHCVFDGNLGGVRPSSAAFEDHPDGSSMSVLLAEIVAETRRGAEAILAGHEDYGLAAITAGLARACGQGVARKPRSDEPAHAEVFGKKPKSVRKRIAKGSEWVLPPPNRLASDRPNL